jgi:hypothetical protein
MIQVCSRCGTRWNVRDRRREWCPRCQGALLAPSAETPSGPSVWSAPGSARAGHRPTSRLPPGYRWIAVRPGAAPPARRRRRPLGPTPRYAVIPRWGLIDPATVADDTEEVQPRRGPSPWTVRATLIATAVVLGVAALVHVVRYALLIVNRTTLLPPLVAGAATWLGVLVSVAAILAVVACAVVLTNWLIARRAAAFEYRGLSDPRPLWALRAGCLVPLLNLAWAPVYVIELGAVEDRYPHLRRTIVAWWLTWLASTIIAAFATATSFTQDAQGIANNTVTFTFAYLLSVAAVVLTAQVIQAFERTPVERPVRRWVVVEDRPSDTAESAPESPATVEPEGQEPAA